MIEFLTDLPDKQQEFLVGGADFELNNSNFRQNLVNKRAVTTSGPEGNTANTNISNNAVNNSAQAYLGLGGMIPSGITTLSPPVLDGGTANLIPGMDTSGSINTTMSQAPITNVLP